MRAAIYHGAGQPLSIDHVEDLTPGPEEVVIKVSSCGICGSDLHLAQYGLAAPGTVFGHEFSGTISALGSNVSSDLKIGDRVVVNPYDSCRNCKYCDAGHLSLCSQAVFRGLNKPGAYAQNILVPARTVLPLPADVSFEEGALIEPLAVAHHALQLAKLQKTDSVLVLGGGPIGLAVLLMCKLADVSKLVLSEPNAIRRKRATEFGAHDSIDPTTSPLAEQIAEKFDGPPSVVIECVGVEGVIQDAITVAAPAGRVVVVGACMTEDRFYPAFALIKEICLQFSSTYTESDFTAVLELLTQKKIDATPMITRKLSLDETPEAFAELSKDPQQIKVLIQPNQA